MAAGGWPAKEGSRPRDGRPSRRQVGRLERYFDKVQARATDAHDKLRIAHPDLEQANQQNRRLDADLGALQRMRPSLEAKVGAQETQLRHYLVVIEQLGADLERHLRAGATLAEALDAARRAMTTDARD